jgi:hypothetical protein
VIEMPTMYGFNRVIVTAAHCLPPLKYTPDASHDQWEWTFPDVLAPLGKQPAIMTECLFVDPVADLAVLGPPDDQELSDEAHAYETLVEAADVLPIAAFDADFGTEAPAWLLSLDCEWFRCKASQYGGPLFITEAEEPIRGGMSGSPILNEAGEAIGLVSCSAGSGDPDTYTKGGPNPCLVRDLPTKFLNAVAAANGRPARD